MNIITTRRSFLAGATAFSLSGCAGGGSGLFGGRVPNLRLGVVSDIHITDWKSTEIFRKTLRYFRDAGVDAVLIAGDIADHGILPELENTAKAWFEVFPDDKGLGGRHVERLFVYGNHDIEGLGYRDKFMDAAFDGLGIPRDKAGELELRKIGLGKSWEMCFHEAYEPIGIKNVKGYDFVLAHWDSWKGVEGLEDWFRANVSKIDVTKPFFFTQHPHPKDTCYGPWAWGHDGGQSTRALSPYRNAIAFSGHSHTTLTDERSVWRGEFTSIGTSSLSYTCLPGARANGREFSEEVRSKLSIRQGQLVSVYDDCIIIERRDFCRDETIDAAWRLEVPEKPASFESRAAGSAIPEFPKDASISVVMPDEKGQKEKNPLEISVSFPPATANADARPYDYDVILESRASDVVLTEKSWRVYGPSAALPRVHDADSGNVTFRFDSSFMPHKMEYRLTAIPRNSYGAAGSPISTAWTKSPA